MKKFSSKRKSRLATIRQSSFKIILFFAFLCAPFFSVSAANSDLEISEVMYSPIGADDKHEWVEIYNSGADPITIKTGSANGSWRFYDGSNHTFTLYQGSNILSAGVYVILADDPKTFLIDHPNVTGTVFKVSMSLNNKGDNLKLSDNSGSTWFYQTGYISFFGSDGNGKSLEKDGDVFRESFVDSGTPGRANSSIADLPTKKEYTNRIYISEIFPHPPTGQSEKEFIELYNDSPNDIDLAGWKLDDEPNTGSSEYTILVDRVGGSVIKTSDFLVFQRSETGLALNDSSGDMARLVDPNGREISQTPNYGKAPENQSFARGEKGVWHWTNTITPGNENIISQKATTLVIEGTTTTVPAKKIVKKTATTIPATTTTTAITITNTAPIIKREVKGFKGESRRKNIIRRIMETTLDDSILLLILLLGDYLWKLQRKAPKRPKN